MSFRLRPEDESDIAAIARHIARDSPSAALRWIEDIEMRCRRLGDMPGIGVARDDIRTGLRMSVAGRHLVLYREAEGGAEIVCVVHGARQWQDLL